MMEIQDISAIKQRTENNDKDASQKKHMMKERQGMSEKKHKQSKKKNSGRD